MRSIFAHATRIAARSAWIAFLPTLIVCSGDKSTGTTETPPPAKVSDLTVSAVANTSVVLAFTQVDDGTGQAASYDVRFAPTPMSWSAATPAVSGSCATPVGGTAVGSALTCSIVDLSPGTDYDFQLVAFRGTLGGTAVFGDVSNIAKAKTPPVVSTVSVDPAAPSIGVGATVGLQATARDANGNVISGRTFTWSTSDGNVATVSSAGVVSGIAAGSATVTASVAGKSGTSMVTVTAVAPPPPVVTTVTIAPTSASVAAGSTVALTATVKDAQGNVMTGQTIAWTSSNTAAATVNASGVVTGVAAGSVIITATCAGKSGTSAITVTAVAPVVTTVTVSPPSATIAAGATAALSATVKDAQGNVMTGQTVTWTSSNTAAATVNASGVVTGVAAGSATITATCAGKTGTSVITVTAVAPVVTTVTVSPPSATIAAGGTVALSATVKDAQGNVMTGQTITWTTSNSASATVNLSGGVTGVAGGSATITATCSGKTGTAGITVTASSGSGALLFEEDFENTSLASRGWYDNTGSLLSTVEHIAGSASSAQYRFLAGATTPTSGNAQRHKFTPTNSFYLSYYVKYSANWVGSTKAYHPHEFQVMSTLDGDWDGPSNGYMVLYVEQNYQNGGKPRLAMQDNKSINSTAAPIPSNLIGVTENRSTGGCNGMSETNMFSECFDAGGYWYNDKQLTGPVVFQPTAGAGYKNNWNFVEAYFQLNTIVGGIGQADGVMQYWFNGTLILDRHDILYRTGAHPTLQFSQFIIAPYIGDGSPVDQSMFIDNLRVGTGRLP
jgi:uncharacterized protein YjdB